MKRQFPAFRGLAIVIVVFFHSIVMVNDIPVELGYPPMEGWKHIFLSILGSLGIFAVPTFLFISGSFFAYATQTRGKGAKFLYKVSWANIIHILWPYIIWSIAFYIAIFIGRGETYSISGYIKNLIVGYPYHFIPLLIFNYFLAPIFLLLGKRFGWILLLAIAIYQVTLINLLHLGGSTPSPRRQSEHHKEELLDPLHNLPMRR